jgi:hypothetical protein
MEILSELQPNKGYPYKRAWDMLFPFLSPSIQAKVLEARNNDSKPCKEVVEFIKKVIALAEQDDKKL